MKCGAIILCGGLSSRMGVDKNWLSFGDETMLQRVVRIVGAVLDPVVVVARGQQRLPTLPDHVQVVHDRHPEAGPLAGLFAGLQATLAAGQTHAFATGCDFPLLKAGLIQRLVALSIDQQITMPLLHGIPQPLVAVYATSLLSAIECLLADGAAGPTDLLKRARARTVDAEAFRQIDPALDSFRNLNTTADYEKAMVASGITSSFN